MKIMTDYEKIRKQEKKTKKVKRTRQGSRLTKHSMCIRKPIFIILGQSQQSAINPIFENRNKNSTTVQHKNQECM